MSVNIEKENEINNNVEISNENEINSLETKQNKFLESVLGKTINTGVDIALRTILPNSVEDHVINVKNILINEGLKEGIKNAVNSAIDLGKSTIGIITGKFENISQAYTAVKSGGIIDCTSKAIDTVVKTANKNGLINDKTAKLLKGGKKIIKESVSSNIEKTFLDQVDNIEKIGKYIKNWNQYLENKDLKGMKREYNKINNKIENILPLQNTLKEVEAIENVQTLIKNKGGTLDNVTQEEIDLAKKLTE
jgi:hypothetical protein